MGISTTTPVCLYERDERDHGVGAGVNSKITMGVKCEIVRRVTISP